MNPIKNEMQFTVIAANCSPLHTITLEEQASTRNAGVLQIEPSLLVKYIKRKIIGPQSHLQRQKTTPEPSENLAKAIAPGASARIQTLSTLNPPGRRGRLWPSSKRHRKEQRRKREREIGVARARRCYRLVEGQSARGAVKFRPARRESKSVLATSSMCRARLASGPAPCQWPGF